MTKLTQKRPQSPLGQPSQGQESPDTRQLKRPRKRGAPFSSVQLQPVDPPISRAHTEHSTADESNSNTCILVSELNLVNNENKGSEISSRVQQDGSIPGMEASEYDMGGIEKHLVLPDPLNSNARELELKAVEKLEAEKAELKEEKEKLEAKEKKLEAKEEKLEEEKEKLEAKEKKLEEELEKLEVEKRDLLREMRDLNEMSQEASHARNADLVGDTSNRQGFVKQNLCRVERDQNAIREQIALVRGQLKSVGEQLTLVLGQLKSVRDNMSFIAKDRAILDDTLGNITKQLSKFLQPPAPPADGSHFSSNAEMTDLANHLLATNGLLLDNGLQVFDLPHIIIPDQDLRPRLVTRRHSRGVCESAIKWLEKEGAGSRAILTGSPGIGKSWSLLYCLRILLLGGKKVLFASRKNYMYVLFECDGSAYTAKSCIDRSDVLVVRASEDTWVLVDPRENGNDINYAPGRLILSASPNRRHFLNWDKETCEKFFMDMCTEDECFTWSEALGTSAVEKEVISSRLQVVGGAPRYIFNQKKFLSRKKDMEDGELSEDQVHQLLSITPLSMRGQREQHLSTLYLTYKLTDGTDLDVDYTSSQVEFASHYAMVRLVEQVMNTAFKYVVNNNNPSMATYYGARFEDLVCARLLSEGDFHTSSLPGRGSIWKGQSSVIKLPKANVCYVSSKSLMLEMMKDEVAMRSGLKEREGRLFFVAPKNFPIVDFVDSDGRWFNATTNVNHPIAPEALRDILNKLGKVEGRGEGTKAIDLYWCVPDTPDFKNNFRARPIPSELERHVQQHALWIPDQFKIRKDSKRTLSEIVTGMDLPRRDRH